MPGLPTLGQALVKSRIWTEDEDDAAAEGGASEDAVLPGTSQKETDDDVE